MARPRRALLLALAPMLAFVHPPEVPPFRVGFAACVDPLSLRPASPRVRVAENHDAWALSPDRRKLALGISAPGETLRLGVRIIDLRDWSVRDVATGVFADGLAWLTPRRLVARLGLSGVIRPDQTVVPGGPKAAVIDPVSATVVRLVRLGARTGPAGSSRRHLVMLAARRERLLWVDSTGRSRDVRLRLASNALLVDGARERAYVFGREGGRVASVNLTTGRVSHRRLRPASFTTRQRSEVAIPRAGGTRPAGQAVWLGSRLAAVAVAEGARLVDLRRFTVQTIDRTAARVAPMRGGLVAYGPRGVRGYGLDGTPRFELLGRARVWNLLSTGNRAYASTSRELHVLDLPRGRIVRRLRPAPSVEPIPGLCAR
jgi:hypothetical protein